MKIQIAVVIAVLSIGTMVLGQFELLPGSLSGRSSLSTQGDVLTQESFLSLLQEYKDGVFNGTIKVAEEKGNDVCEGSCNRCSSGLCSCIGKAINCLDRKLCKIRLGAVDLYCLCDNLTDPIFILLRALNIIVNCLVCQD